jgi:hypothetical protein
MEITKEQARQIERITSEMECPKDFKCRKSGFENLCKTKLVAGDQLVECLEESKCRFALTFGASAFCKCPLRIYIARNFKI